MMRYTPEQYALLETFEKGRLVQKLSEEELYTYHFLMDEKLLQPRADIEDGFHLLSEQGKCILEEQRLRKQNIEQKARELAEQKAADKKAKAADRRHDFLILFIGAIISFLLDNIDRVSGWISAMRS